MYSRRMIKENKEAIEMKAWSQRLLPEWRTLPKK